MSVQHRYYIELQEHGQEKFSPLNPKSSTSRAGSTLPLVAHQRLALHARRAAPPSRDPAVHRHQLDGARPEPHAHARRDTFYVHSEEEMRALFPELPEVVDNTARIAEQVRHPARLRPRAAAGPRHPRGADAHRAYAPALRGGPRRRYVATPRWSRQSACATSCAVHRGDRLRRVHAHRAGHRAVTPARGHPDGRSRVGRSLDRAVLPRA